MYGKGGMEVRGGGGGRTWFPRDNAPLKDEGRQTGKLRETAIRCVDGETEMGGIRSWKVRADRPPITTRRVEFLKIKIQEEPKT